MTFSLLLPFRRILNCGGVATLIACLSWGTPVAAQPPGGDFRGGGFRGGDGGGRRMFDPGEMISRLDQNGNGQIDPEEMQGPARFFLERAARDNNLDLSKPVPTAKLREIMQARFQQGGGPGGNRSGSSGGSGNGSSAPTKPVVIAPNAFGVDKPLTPVPGFGGPPGPDSWEVIKAKYDQRIVQRVEEMLGRMDKNKDGILDAEEIQSGQWRGDPYESDLNKDGKLTRSELAERQRLRDQNGGGFSGGGFPGGGFSGGGGFSRGGGFSGGGFQGGDFNGGFGGGGSSGSSSSGGSSRSTPAPVPPVQPYKVYGAANPSSSASKYGATSTTPAVVVSAPSSSAPATGEVAPPPAAIPQPVLDFAESTIKEYDLNKDGTLDADEVSKMSSRRRKADVNADGKITKDELIAYQMGFQSSSPTASSSTTSSASAGSVTYGGRVASTKGIKTYRFLTPVERMPQGLPDWFVRSDSNGDGQVSMKEFSSTWDDAKAAEFTRWDRNGDGFVTTREATAK